MTATPEPPPLSRRAKLVLGGALLTLTALVAAWFVLTYGRGIPNRQGWGDVVPLLFLLAALGALVQGFLKILAGLSKGAAEAARWTGVDEQDAATDWQREEHRHKEWEASLGTSEGFAATVTALLLVCGAIAYFKT